MAGEAGSEPTCHACGLAMGWLASTCSACGTDGIAALQAVLGVAHGVVDLAGSGEGRMVHRSLHVEAVNPYREVVAEVPEWRGQAPARGAGPVPVALAPGLPRCTDCGEALRAELAERGRGSVRCGCGSTMIDLPTEALAAYAGLRAALVEGGDAWVWLGGPSPLRRQLERQQGRATDGKAAPGMRTWLVSLGVVVCVGSVAVEVVALWTASGPLTLAGGVVAVLGALAVQHGHARL